MGGPRPCLLSQVSPGTHEERQSSVMGRFQLLTQILGTVTYRLQDMGKPFTSLRLSFFISYRGIIQCRATVKTKRADVCESAWPDTWHIVSPQKAVFTLQLSFLTHGDLLQVLDDTYVCS